MKDEINSSKETVTKTMLSLALFLATYFAITARYGNGYSDFPAHAKIAGEFSLGDIKQQVMNGNTYFLWHALVSLLFNRANVSLAGASAVVTAFANVLTLNLILDYMKRKMVNPDNYLWTYLGGGIMFVGPLFFPWINPSYYLGTWSPNVWHNPTNNMVRPFAVAAVILILDMMEGEKNFRWYIVLAIVIGISVMAKPSFIQGIAPAMVLCVLADIVSARRICWKKWIPLAVSFLPAVCIMAFQCWLIFYSGNTVSTGVGVEFSRAIGYYSKNVWVSLLACISFPLFVTIVSVIVYRRDVLKNSRIVLVVSYLTASWLEMAFLYEKGPREKSGNFTWAYMIALFVSWFLCATEFVNIINTGVKHKTLIKSVGLGLFSLHLLMGLWYYITGLSQGFLF